jgi:hypothetical protein
MVAQYTIDLDPHGVEEVWLVMLLQDNLAVTLTSTGEKLPMTMPAGCVGMMLVFDTEEAARAHFGSDAPLVRMMRSKP